MTKKSFLILVISLFIFKSFAQQVENQQRSLITKRAATWCPPCGSWGWSLNDGFIEDNGNRAVYINAHYSGLLETTTSDEITSNWGSFSQPRFFLGHVDQNANSSNNTAIRNTVKTAVDAAFLQAPLANSGFNAVYEDGSIKLDATVKFFAAAEGEFYFGAYLLEDNVVAYQASIGNNAIHHNVLRYSFTESSWGDLVKNGSVAAGEEFSLSYALPIGDPAGYDYEIVGIVWEKVGNKYEVVNVWSTGDIETPSGTTEEKGLFSLSVSPNVVSNLAVIQLQLTESQEDVSLDIYDLEGRLVSNLHRGTLAQGRHLFEFQRELTGSNGVYLVRFVAGNYSTARKVVFH